MGFQNILAQIDREIKQLQQARALLKGIFATPWDDHPSQRISKKRNLTPEGRKRIRDAVKRRWARQKNQAPEASAAAN